MSTDFDCKECKCVSCCGLREELETLKAKVREFIDKIELEDVTDWKTNDIKNLICDLRELVK